MMKVNPSRKTMRMLFIGTFLGMLMVIVANPINLSFAPMADEVQYYQPLVKDWNENGISVIPSHNDTKPLSFLYLQKVLRADLTYKYTRLFNLVLIGIITILIYNITNRKEAFLFVIIPTFLHSLWLTAEIIEVFFMVLSLYFIKYRGIFVGLAVIFRPYAIVYTALINNKERLWVLTLGILFSVILLYHGLFFPYANHLFNYSVTNHLYDETDYGAIIFLILFAILSSKNTEMLKYGLLACIPLAVKLYGHYFIPAYTFFFIGYLLYYTGEVQST